MPRLERRDVLKWTLGSGLMTAGLSACAQVSPEQRSDEHMHHQHGAAVAQGRVNYTSLVNPYQNCTRTARACIAHCQRLLGEGDKSMARCLRTALDTEVVCNAVLKLASMDSVFTPQLAKQSVAVMQACVEACKEHINHHAECKACYDACLTAIEAAYRI